MIYAHVNGKVLKILAAENSSADAFLDLLKAGDVTVDMHDYGSFEKVGPLGTTLPRNDEQITTGPGDVILYQGDQITIYYDVNSWSFTRLGKVQDLSQAELKEILGSGNASVTFSLSERRAASFRALYERLIFQNLTYNLEMPSCNERQIPVQLLMTSNAPGGAYLPFLRSYQQTLNRFIGPTEIFACGDTLQLKDYGSTDWEWSMFDAEAKMIRHETVFPKQCGQVREMSRKMFS